MRKVFIIGIGAGNPDYVTVQAINALNEAHSGMAEVTAALAPATRGATAAPLV
jgi:precorrin-2 methylase